MFNRHRVTYIQETQASELATRRMIFETCDFNTIIENEYLREAMGW